MLSRIDYTEPKRCANFLSRLFRHCLSQNLHNIDHAFLFCLLGWGNSRCRGNGSFRSTSSTKKNGILMVELSRRGSQGEGHNGESKWLSFSKVDQ